MLGGFLVHTRTHASVGLYLFWFEACEAKHPNLVDDVLPVVRGALLFQTRHQLFSHLYDSVGHEMNLLQPGTNDTGANSLRKTLDQNALARI